jgi:hypothetical protein
VQIVDDARTKEALELAQQLHLATVGAGWSKLGAHTENAAQSKQADSLPTTANAAADFAMTTAQVYVFLYEVGAILEE